MIQTMNTKQTKSQRMRSTAVLAVCMIASLSPAFSQEAKTKPAGKAGETDLDLAGDVSHYFGNGLISIGTITGS